jgi:hypothetical protein
MAVKKKIAGYEVQHHIDETAGESELDRSISLIDQEAVKMFQVRGIIAHLRSGGKAQYREIGTKKWNEFFGIAPFNYITHEFREMKLRPVSACVLRKLVGTAIKNKETGIHVLVTGFNPTENKIEASGEWFTAEELMDRFVNTNTDEAIGSIGTGGPYDDE